MSHVGSVPFRDFCDGSCRAWRGGRRESRHADASHRCACGLYVAVITHQIWVCTGHGAPRRGTTSYQPFASSWLTAAKMGEAAVGVCAECMRWLACRARTRTRTRTPPRARAPFPSSSSCTRVMTRVCQPPGSRKDAKTPSGLAVLARGGTRETQHPLLASTHRVRAPSRLCALARGSSDLAAW